MGKRVGCWHGVVAVACEMDCEYWFLLALGDSFFQQSFSLTDGSGVGKDASRASRQAPKLADCCKNQI